MNRFLTLFVVLVALFSTVEGKKRLRANLFDVSPEDSKEEQLMDRVWQRYLNMANTQEVGEAGRALEMSMSMSMSM